MVELKLDQNSNEASKIKKRMPWKIFSNVEEIPGAVLALLSTDIQIKEALKLYQ